MKPLPIGKDNFKDLIEGGCYYVDKTESIEELLTSQSSVVLFPRPRRFGKSLFMSMLENFFDIDKKEQNKDLFEGLYISKSSYYNELSTYPVINLDFKDLKQSTFVSSYNQFKMLIEQLYRSKSYLLDILDDSEKINFNKVLAGIAEEDFYKNSLKILSIWLERYYNKKVIILIDEYDAAINESFSLGYYRELMNLLQPLLSSTFKGNDSLKMGVLTGVLRVGGESLFSSFNNLDIYDVMSEHYNEYFGFTESETKELLEYYGLELTSEVKDYYDGYNFSGLHIYNPWSILNYANRKVLESYWMNTSSNKLLKELLKNINDEETIEKLMQGESITFNYDKSITYENFTDTTDSDNLYNLLLVLGYITFDRKEKDKLGDINYFKIPNKEVREDFNKIVSRITFSENLFNNNKYREFITAFLNGDKIFIEKFLNEILPSMSYNDYYESFYHGYGLGLFNILLNNNNFIVKSNREAGSGRYDILIETKDREKGVIIEFKVCEEEDKMEEKALEGIKQMREKEYYKELVLDKVKDIKEIVIVFTKKNAIVR